MNAPPAADEWLRWGSAMVSDANGRHGAMAGRMRLLSGDGVAGHAFTVRITPGDSASLHLALDHVPRGRVLVVDGAGFADRAVWGEILTRAALARGIRGLVVDGAVRDLAAIRSIGFPVFAVGTTPAGPHKAGGGAWNIPISCGGTVVRDGDLVVADLDGVTVVPAEAVAEVAQATEEKRRSEERIVSEISRGGASAALLGLREPTTAEAAHASSS